jgi:hypothetical protein
MREAGTGQTALPAACEHVFVTSQGSAYSRFQRSLLRGDALMVRAAAAELPQLELADALAVCLVFLRGDPGRYGRAAVRWHARLCLESPSLGLAEAQLALAALAALPRDDNATAATTLGNICDAAGHPTARRRIDDWLARTVH